MNYIIIEDEADQVEVLKLYMQRFHPLLEFQGHAATVHGGIRLIQNVKPDIIFLDVHLDDGSGFDIMKHFPDFGGALIVFTAFEDQALPAFRHDAIDFIEKPINTRELQVAIDKAMKLLGTKIPEEKFILSLSEGKLFLRMDEIVLLMAKGASTLFFLNRQNQIEEVCSGYSLRRFEERLPSPPFYRIHDKYLLNTNYLESLGCENAVQLNIELNFEKRTARELNVSQQRVKQFREWLKNNG